MLHKSLTVQSLLEPTVEKVCASITELISSTVKFIGETIAFLGIALICVVLTLLVL